MSNEKPDQALAVVNEDSAALQRLPDRKPMALMPQSFDQMMEVAKTLAESGIVPKAYRGKPADIFGAMQYGAELGMMPFASIRNIDVIEGSPSLRARAAMGVCVSEPDCEYFREVLEECKPGLISVWECRRRGTVYRGSFTIDQAKIAGLLGKSNWKCYPAQMLENRAIAYTARKAYPDKLSGVYTPDEVREAIELEEISPGRFEAPPAPAEPPPVDADVIDVETGEVLSEAGKLAEPPPVDGPPKTAEGTELDQRCEKITEKILAAKTQPELDKSLADCKQLKADSAGHGIKILGTYQRQRALINDAAAVDGGEK